MRPGLQRPLLSPESLGPGSCGHGLGLRLRCEVTRPGDRSNNNPETVRRWQYTRGHVKRRSETHVSRDPMLVQCVGSNPGVLCEKCHDRLVAIDNFYLMEIQLNNSSLNVSFAGTF